MTPHEVTIMWTEDFKHHHVRLSWDMGKGLIERLNRLGLAWQSVHHF